MKPGRVATASNDLASSRHAWVGRHLSSRFRAYAPGVRWWGVLVVGLFVFIAACTDSVSSVVVVDRSHGIPILASEVSGTGTRLPDGFRIPEGAALAGPALSERERRGEAEGGPGVVVRRWSAVLGIDGPPLKVVEAFAVQAAQEGLVAERGPECSAAIEPPPPQPP